MPWCLNPLACWPKPPHTCCLLLTRARLNPASCASLGEEESKLHEEAEEEEVLGPWQPAKNTNYISVYYEEEEEEAAVAAVRMPAAAAADKDDDDDDDEVVEEEEKVVHSFGCRRRHAVVMEEEEEEEAGEAVEADGEARGEEADAR